MIRNAIATPLDGSAVLVTMRRGSRGPWSLVCDEPTAGREPLGPPPGFIALVGIATCTIVTCAGVSSRGETSLEGMQVAFDAEVDGSGRLAIRQTTTLVGELSAIDVMRLTRAAEHCPVGKDFTGRGVAIEDHVSLADSGAAWSASEAAIPRVPPAFVAGTVRAAYLPGTAEWLDLDGGRVLDQEGEVIAHVECPRPGATAGRWGFLGGHTGPGWAPRPSAYALAALAASTLITLRSAAARLRIDPATLRVEVAVTSAVPAGGKTESQDAAATGVAQQVRWRRAVTVEGHGASVAAIEQAMALDPIHGHCVRGDLLVGHDIVVVPTGAPAGSSIARGQA